MLIIPTVIIVAYLFFKAGEHANNKRNTRTKHEKFEAYKLAKSYCVRLDALNIQYQLEKKKVAQANETIQTAKLRIACLSAGLKNQIPKSDFDFFDDLKNLSKIKKRYKLLSAAYHPDRGGSQKTMQLINDQYRKAFKYR